MSIRIRKKIDSDTLKLSELRPLIGHTVDIVIEDSSAPGSETPQVVPGVGDWDAVLKGAQQLRDYDYEALSQQDARDIRDAQDRLR